MPCATITVTDITKTAASLQTLIGQSAQPQANPAGNTLTGIPGYSVVVSGAGHGFSLIGRVAYLSVQFSPNAVNSGLTGFMGDENVTSAGTLQAKEMLPGDVDVKQGIEYLVSLAEIFLTASGNNAKFNVEWHYA